MPWAANTGRFFNFFGGLFYFMKWARKYNIDLEEIHKKNASGASLVDLSKEYDIPRTTLNRYLHSAGYTIYMNRKNTVQYRVSRVLNRSEYTCTSSWKRALIVRYGHRCIICGYDKIIEAHHIIPQECGGKTTIDNGVLLCPNHHAEAHAGILDLRSSLVKRGELLENPEDDNKQIGHDGNRHQLTLAIGNSATSTRTESIPDPKGSRSNRLKKDEYINKNRLLDIV